MIKKETVRIGAIKSELDAARIYDILAILTEGLNVSFSLLIYFLEQNKFRLHCWVNPHYFGQPGIWRPTKLWRIDNL